jgi:hypothetical protein
MVYTPTVNVFDERPIKDNLIGFFEDNQADALLWANNGVALPSIAKFHRNPRLVTVFPALSLLQTSHKSDYEDLLPVDFEILLELAIVHGNQDELTIRAPKYALALESLLVNMPQTTLMENSIIEAPAFTTGVEVTFNVQGKYKNKFIEVFQMRAAWKITAPAYA